MKHLIIGFVLGGSVVWILFSFLVAPVDTHTHDAEQVMTPDETHDGAMVHAHEQVAVAADANAPTVNVRATADAKDGYNIQIETGNFTFAPERVNEAVVQNEGHAHIYVNNIKIARVYGNWFHISSGVLQAGENTVKVTLNANDHSEWAVGEKSIEASTVIEK